jgi:glycosyltransferase involved in cell wall biosynthesis
MVGRYAAAGATEHLIQADFPIHTPWSFIALAEEFRGLFTKIKPDIIHSHFVGTTLTMRLSLGRNHETPRVFQVPGPLHLEHPLFRIAELATGGRSDFWIGSCRWTCNRYTASGINAQRVFLSYYGTDLELLRPSRPGRLRAELRLGPECKVVGMVAFMYAPKRYLGQTRGLKGHEDLIDAIQICVEREPKMKCVIVGGAWNNAKSYEEQVRGYAKRRCGDRISFLGTRDDIADLYGDFDIAVHPSHSENVGGAVESLLAGVPTVATRVGGFPDLVRDGETGWLVPSKDPRSLALAILEGLRDTVEAKKRAQAGQKLARQLFDVRKTACEIKMIYEEILASHGRN